MLSVKERVQNGSTLLDSTVPGWYNKIDLSKLRIQHCDRCVLGQLYGEYTLGCNVLLGEHTFDDRYKNGFSSSESDVSNELWKQAIRLRRKMDKRNRFKKVVAAEAVYVGGSS